MLATKPRTVRSRCRRRLAKKLPAGAGGGVPSPTELSISTSPARRASPLAFTLDSASSTPSDQHHPRLAEMGDELADIAPAPRRPRRR